MLAFITFASMIYPLRTNLYRIFTKVINLAGVGGGGGNLTYILKIQNAFVGFK